MSSGSSCSRRSASTGSRPISTCATDRSSLNRWARGPPRVGRRRPRSDARWRAQRPAIEDRDSHVRSSQPRCQHRRGLRATARTCWSRPAASGGAIFCACWPRPRPDRCCCRRWSRSRRARRRPPSRPSPISPMAAPGSRPLSAAFFEPFTKKTGIPVQYQEPYSFAKLRAMHEAKAQQIDIAGLSGMDVYIGARIKMISADRLEPGRQIGARSPAASPRERHRLLQPVDEHVLQQEEMAGCGASRTRGRISGTWRNFPAVARCGATPSGPWKRRPRPTASRTTPSIRSTSIGCFAASTASSRTSRPGGRTTRRRSN